MSVIVTHQIEIDRAAICAAQVEESATAYMAVKVGRLLERIAHLQSEVNDLGAMLDKALNRAEAAEARVAELEARHG